MLDANLARAFLSNSIDMHTIEALGTSRLLMPADLPESVKKFLGKLPDPRDTTVPPETIRDSISALISRNLPVLDVLAAHLVRFYKRPLGACPAWNEFMLTRAPADMRLEYTWFFAGQNSPKRPPSEAKVEILKDAVTHGVAADRNFENLIFEEDERLFILSGALGKNDLSNALMRGMGQRWAADARAKDLKANHATLEFIKKIGDREKDDTLYSVLCAIMEYVTGSREGRDPEAEAVIAAILDKATTSPDKKIEYLARTIKQLARYYNWSFVEPPTYRTGIDMVDYMYLSYVPEEKK